MTLLDLFNRLDILMKQGHKDKKVFAIHSASGAADEVNGAYISSHIGDAGPFDIQLNEEYISMSIGD